MNEIKYKSLGTQKNKSSKTLLTILALQEQDLNQLKSEAEQWNTLKTPSKRRLVSTAKAIQDSKL
jgi:hypothetical protein